ncbi:uncharacterized protein [Arachis hypogaea]|uniref:uncharacterized protein isoform X3 n=1 Tax=Arachis hypogaea TaxID=3818 RepID=UPI000DEDA3B6|nr:uncharacterized protein LOC112770687 isoform X2 [Arachis hypogaea]XP_025670812.1 uncharacterized protein LOC112770687 isoform X2 [Arachis hypogaea]
MRQRIVPKLRYDIPRHQVKQVICSLCGTEQEVSKKQYHCGGCGICRTGGSENCFHRDKCGRKEKKRKQKLQYDPIDIETIDKVDFWVTEEVVEKEHDLPSNIEDLLDDIDADLDQGGGGGGGSTSTFYAAPLGFSGSSSENEGDEINDANLQQVMEDFDD